jgi:hypothetical protein
MMNV